MSAEDRTITMPTPPPTPRKLGTNARSSGSSDQDRTHVINVLQLRTAVALGTVVHVLFWGFDWLIATYAYPGVDPVPFLGLRLAMVPFSLLALRLLFAPTPPSVRLLAWMDTVAFSASSATVGVIGAYLGGIAGPYTPGVFLVLICRGAFRSQPWRDALLPVSLVIASYFGALIITTMGSEQIAELLSPKSLALFVLHACSLIGGALLIMTASDRAWVLRNRVFAARALGHYRLEYKLAEGGHGEVWQATDTRGQERVAVKVLKGVRAFDHAARARFRREARALAVLRSPHTVRVLDAGISEDGLCYLVTELLEGQTLAELVASAGPLAEPRVLRLFTQAARALAEAHTEGIVHRDIKPENLFVVRGDDSQGELIKLLDFGIARTAMPQDTHLTRTGMVLGTPAFMAPEVLRGACAGTRSDVYALGAILVFMRTGSPPQLDSPTADDGMALTAVANRCLDLSPEKRFADASEVVEALERL